MFKIQKQILDLHYHSEENARDFQDHVKRLYYARIIPEMEAILEKHDIRESIVKINTFELDLGEIEENVFDDEWVKRFAEEFEVALLKRLYLIRTEKGATQETQIPIRKRHAEILEHYLLYGTLPWNADHELTPAIMVEELLAYHPRDLVLILKKHGSNEKVIRRLVIQLSEKLITRIIEAVQTTEAKFIIETVEKIDLTRRKDAFVKADSIHFRSKLWEFVLSYILEDRGSYFNTKEFVKSMLHSMADHFNMERIQLIIQFYQAIQSLKEELSLSMQLWQIIYEIYEEDSQTNNLEITNKRYHIFDVDKQKQPITTSNSLDQIPLNDEDIQHIIDQLIFQPIYFEIIKKWLAEKGGDATFRKSVSNAIRNVKQFEKLVKLIDAPHTDYIVGFSKRLQQDQEKEKIFPTSAAQFQKDQYYVILTVLLSDRGSYFNKKSFIRQVLQQLAAEYNITLHTLLHTLIRSVPNHMQGLSQLPEIMQLLDDLEQEEAKTITTDIDTAETTPEWLLQAIQYWVETGTAPTWLHEKTYIQSSSFERLWVTLMQSKNPQQEWISILLSDIKNITFLSKELSETTFITTVQYILPTTIYREVQAFMVLLDELSVYEKRYTINLHTYQQQKTVCLFTHIFALQKQRINLSEYIEKAFVYFSEIWHVPVNQLVLESIQQPHVSITHSPSLKAALERMYEKQMYTTMNSASKKVSGADLIIQNFTSEFGNLEPTSSTFQKEMAITFKLIQEKHSTEQAWNFVKKIFSRTNFLTFITTQVHAELLELLKENVLKENGYFLSPLIKDLIFIFHKAQITISQSRDWISKAIIFSYFSGEKKEFIYVTNMLSFLADAKKINYEQLRKHTKQTAIEQKIHLNSKIILHLYKEDDVEIPATQETKRNNEKLIIPFTTEKKEEILDTIAIKNAGIVLVWPFMSLYFERLGLTQNGAFNDVESNHRAVHLLQYLANQQTDYPEHGLALPKILCGLHPSDPIPLNIQITDEEKTLAESLLNGIIQQWSVLKNTSANALRETFITRDGLLYQKEKGWELHVDPKPFDVLLDQRPWGIQIIKLPWMKTTLYSKWR